MDFLDNFVLPQTHEHLILLKYLLGLTFSLFVPYLAILVGSTFFALLLKSKGADEKNAINIKLARDLVNLVTFNKSIVFVLGVLPLFSALFCYLQILQGAGSLVGLYIILALVSFVAGIILLFIFRNSFNLSKIFSYIDKKQYAIDDEEAKESFEEYKERSAHQFEKSGLWSLVFLVITAVLFIAAVELASSADLWKDELSFVKILFSVGTISYILYFLAASITITSALILFYYYKVKTEAQNNHAFIASARKMAIEWGMVSVLVQPVLIALNVVFTPETALSSMAFVVILLMLIALLMIASFYYFMMKDSSVNYAVPVLVLSLAVFVASNIVDQLSFASASRYQLAELEKKFNIYEEEFKASLGIAAVAVSGEDIFNSKCIACHSFDKRVTGPPYNEVLPKYIGKKDQLVKFVMNPVKVNPDYPSMPNQGLKPNEADAIAEYLLNTYESTHGGADSTAAGADSTMAGADSSGSSSAGSADSTGSSDNQEK